MLFDIILAQKTILDFKKYKYSDIHFKYYFDKTKEVNLVSINTDDTMLFSTNICQEFFEIAMSHDLDVNDLKNILRNTVSFIFDKSEMLRKELIDKIDR